MILEDRLSTNRKGEVGGGGVSDTHRVYSGLFAISYSWSALGDPFLELNDSPVTFYASITSVQGPFFNKDGLAIPEH